MKPYLLTLSSETEGMSRFLKSLDNLGGNYEHIAVQFSPFTNMFTTAKYDFPYPGHLKRHLYIPDNLDLERYVIFTDTDDVIFQSPFPEFTSDIYLAAENILHKDTIWNHWMKGTVFAPVLMEKPVYNCGMFIMRVSIIYEYKKFLKEVGVGDFNKYNWEQPHFNYFIALHPEYSLNIDLSILCPLYNNLEQKLVKKEDGIWKTKTDKIINCVHSNGNKGLL
jgi:hypothetical protein